MTGMSDPSFKRSLVRKSRLSHLSAPPPPIEDCYFRYGFHVDRNYPSRKTMEDSHTALYKFNGIVDQGFFAVFDGHGGKTAALWCEEYFHQIFAKNLTDYVGFDGMEEIIRRSYRQIDSEMTPTNGIYSGCTAVTCFLTEERFGGQDHRILYTGNVGDARAVLFRSGKSIRLTYDHKGSDPQEQERIRTAGGFINNCRVNGLLAVTRSLGDYEFKELIVGEPYVTRTELDDQDTILILACDGVWDVLDEMTACKIADGFNDPMKAAAEISNQAILQGSGDNITVIVIFLTRRSEASVTIAG